MLDRIFQGYIKIFDYNKLYLKHFRIKSMIMMGFGVFINIIFMFMPAFQIYQVCISAICLAYTLFAIKKIIPIEIEFISVRYYQTTFFQHKAMLRRNFYDFLYDNEINLNNPEQIKTLILFLNQYIVDQKPKEIIRSGTATFFIAPAWVFFIQNMFNGLGTNIGASFGLFILVFFTVFLFDKFFIVFEYSIREIFYNRYNRIIEMKNLIEEIHILSLSQNNEQMDD